MLEFKSIAIKNFKKSKTSCKKIFYSYNIINKIANSNSPQIGRK